MNWIDVILIMRHQTAEVLMYMIVSGLFLDAILQVFINRARYFVNCIINKNEILFFLTRLFPDTSHCCLPFHIPVNYNIL